MIYTRKEAEHIVSVSSFVLERKTLMKYTTPDEKENIETLKQEISLAALNKIADVLKDPMIMSLMKKLIKYDEYTFIHSISVAEKSYKIGMTLDMNDDEMQDLLYASILHDVGKMFIPAEILNSNKKLNNYEFDVIKMHAEIGADYIKKLRVFSDRVVEAIRYHHEDYNGLGYYGLKGKEISIFARIIRIADTFSAMTDNRCYHKGKLPQIVIEEMKSFDSIDKALFEKAAKIMR